MYRYFDWGPFCFQIETQSITDLGKVQLNLSFISRNEYNCFAQLLKGKNLTKLT